MNSATKRAKKRYETSSIVLRRLRQPEKWDNSRRIWESWGVYPPKNWISCYKGFLTNLTSAENGEAFSMTGLSFWELNRGILEIFALPCSLWRVEGGKTLVFFFFFFTLWKHYVSGNFALFWNKIFWRGKKNCFKKSMENGCIHLWKIQSATVKKQSQKLFKKHKHLRCLLYIMSFHNPKNNHECS